MREQIAQREEALREAQRFLAEAPVWLADVASKRGDLIAEWKQIVALDEEQLKKLRAAAPAQSM